MFKDLVIIESVKQSGGFTGEKTIGNYVYVYVDGKLVSTHMKTNI